MRLSATFAFLSAWPGISLGAASLPPPATASAPSGLESLGIPSSYQVSYQDENGHALTAAAFHVRSAVTPFNIRKDIGKHTAALRLMSKAEIDEAHTSATHPLRLPLVGKPFPPFRATTLSGQTLTLDAYRGKTVIINFFFAQCGPCIRETPALNEFKRTHPGVDVLAITYDDRATAADFMTKRGFSWPIVFDQQPLIDRARLTVYPTMVLVGPDGIVRKETYSSNIAGLGKELTAQALSSWLVSD